MNLMLSWDVKSAVTKAGQFGDENDVVNQETKEKEKETQDLI